MNRLTENGFIKVGAWNLSALGIKFLLTSHHEERKVLYSFISGGRVLYIGKTTQSLISRMKGYQNPGPTQRTNIRVNKNIIQLLESGLPIDIYVLTDPGLLQHGCFKISLAGGLEDNLIDEFKPDWNITGKSVGHKSPKQLERPKIHQNRPQDIGSTSFEVILSPTYYNQGFFNVRRKLSDRFGNDQDLIKIQLGHDSGRCINGIIDRRANINVSPRIRGRKPLKEWITSNFKQGDVMLVEILSPVAIKIANPKYRV
jgi:hypothetical protein